MSDLNLSIGDKPIFAGQYQWEFNYEEPVVYNVLVPESRDSSPDYEIATNSNVRFIPDEAFSVPDSSFLEDIEFSGITGGQPFIRPRPDLPTNPANVPNTPTTFDTDWLKVNKLLDFTPGNYPITSIDKDLITEFFIKYNFKGRDKVYKFSIAPSTESYLGGPNQTPEVKAGILTRSSVAIKTFSLAGGEPIYQVLGIEPTLFSLTGLFIGSETNTSTSSTTSSLTSNVYNPRAKLTAVKAAELFDTEVAKSGRTIEVHLYSKNNGTDEAINIKYLCLIQNARYFLRRSDRVYYALDLFLLRRL